MAYLRHHWWVVDDCTLLGSAKLTRDESGELTFGEPFNAIRDAQPNYWITLLLGANYGGSIFSLRNRLPLVGPLLRWAPSLSSTAAEAVKCMTQHRTLTLEKTKKRIQMGESHRTEDFFAHAIKMGYKDENELANQANVLINAGASRRTRKGPLHINTCFPCHKTNTLRYTTTKVSLIENEV